MTELTATVSDWIALISAVAAVAAAIFTFWSITISKKGLASALAEQARKNPNVDLYLVDSFRVRSSVHDRYVYAFCISISNLSDSPDSISRMELEVPCHEPNGPKAIHVFSHAPGAREQLPQRSLKLIPSPCALTPKACITGWALFEMPVYFLNTFVIDRFRVVVHTVAAEYPSVVETYLVSELHDANAEKS